MNISQISCHFRLYPQKCKTRVVVVKGNSICSLQAKYKKGRIMNIHSFIFGFMKYIFNVPVCASYKLNLPLFMLYMIYAIPGIFS